MQNNTENKAMPQWTYMAGLIFVIVMWGITPVINKKMYAFYSPTVYTTLMGIVAAIALFFVARKYFGVMTKKMLRVSILTSFLYSAASIMLKVGLQYTTPSKSSFLDTLACVAVPLTLFLITKKMPSVWKIVAAFICLAGCFVLTDLKFNDFSAFGIGEILCALAGILFGVNTAVNGICSKDICVPVHVMIQMITMAISSAIISLIFNFVTIGGEPIEKVRFTVSLWPLVGVVLMGFMAYAVGWFIRIYALKGIDASVVGVMMPMSSLVTVIFSSIMGTDVLSPKLVIGGALVICASIISNISGAKKSDPLPNVKGEREDDEA